MKYLIILSVLIFSTVAYSQNLKTSQVPAVVQKKFAGLYPNIKKVAWEMEDGNYEAGFDFGKVETSVLITPTGTLVCTESEIDIKALPVNVVPYVTKNYPGQKIKEAAKIVSADGKITYEAEIKGKDLIFDEKGNFLK